MRGVRIGPFIAERLVTAGNEQYLNNRPSAGRHSTNVSALIRRVIQNRMRVGPSVHRLNRPPLTLKSMAVPEQPLKRKRDF